jgi:hypothetical protein
VIKAEPFAANLWHVKVKNESNDTITDLQVTVRALDRDGNEVIDGCTQVTDKTSIAEGAAGVIVESFRTMMAGMRAEFDQFAQHAIASAPQFGLTSQQMLENYFSQTFPLLDEQSAAALKEQVMEGVAREYYDSWPSELSPGQMVLIAFKTTHLEYKIVSRHAI